jgi:hypothetical protein
VLKRLKNQGLCRLVLKLQLGMQHNSLPIFSIKGTKI